VVATVAPTTTSLTTYSDVTGGYAAPVEDTNRPGRPMPIVACPTCGEDEELTGQRSGEAILLSCGRCGHAWDRDTRLVCGLCGGQDIEGIPTSTLEEAGRAGVRTPSGIRLVYYCWSCRGNDVVSTEPVRGPHPPPGRSRDVRALRRADT
jgi:hypothetical protein